MIHYTTKEEEGEEAKVAALNRQEWCLSVAQYVQLHVEWTWDESSQVKSHNRCKHMI